MSLIVNVAIIVCIALVSILFGSLIYYKVRDGSGDRVYEAHEELQNRKKAFIRLKPKTYEKLQIYLSKVGANYLMKRVVDPVEFVIARYVIAVAGAYIGYIMFGIAGAGCGLIVGYMLLKKLLDINNKKDNENIVNDLMSIYLTIKIKIESGVFLTDALNSCYKVATCKRLKEELYTLITDISLNNNIMVAIEKFKLKFDCIHINTFCTVIRQGYETGDTMTAISNVSTQLKDIQRATEIRNKKKLENEIMKVNFIILVSIFVVVIYALVISFISSMESIGF